MPTTIIGTVEIHIVALKYEGEQKPVVAEEHKSTGWSIIKDGYVPIKLEDKTENHRGTDGADLFTLHL